MLKVNGMISLDNNVYCCILLGCGIIIIGCIGVVGCIIEKCSGVFKGSLGIGRLRI